MSTVTNTSNTSSTSTALASASSGKTAEELKTDFLNLLVTQLKNQDPLNPMDNAQMTSQLAQINTVSGIEKLNTTLGTLMESYTNTQNMQAANLIGHAVLTPGTTLSLGTSGAVGGLSLDAAADKVTVTIKDAAGNIVQTVDLGALSKGTTNFMWDGQDSNGNAMTQGEGYTFAVAATNAGKAVLTTPLKAGMVNAVTLNSDGMKLDLGDGTQVSYSNVKQIL
jgi:flagellar basal-body rod modification protein FlgD